MITVRPSSDRGRTNLGWLDSRHTFSFGQYRDPEHMGFRSLRVINDDRITPGAGFDIHPHRDMEIISYVLEGELAHKDSMGNGSTIRPGDVQHMSAGTGVLHSEFNPSKTKGGRFLQIWIIPANKGDEPRYGQRSLTEEQRHGRIAWVATPDGQNDSIRIGQDARLGLTLLDNGQRVTHAIQSGRHAWVQVARGSVTLNGRRLDEGDGAAISDEDHVELVGAGDGLADVLVFTLN